MGIKITAQVGIGCVMSLKTAAILFIFVVTFTIYSNSLGGEFSWDDDYFIVKNPYVRDPLDFKTFFTNPSATAFGELSEDVYRPLTAISYSIDYSLFRLNTFGYHLVNTIFHALNAMLVFLILYRIGRDYFLAVFASLFFAAHPVQTEAVSWISGRSNVLFLFFYLMAFFFYIRFSESGKKRFFIAALAAFGGSLFSKEMALTLPLVLVLYDAHFSKRKRGPGKIFKYIPFFALAAVYFAARFMVLNRVSQCSWWGADPYYTFVTMVKVFGRYLNILVWPAGLCAYYFIPVSQSLLEKDVLIAIVMLSAIFASLPLFFKKYRIASFGIMLFFITMIPVSNVVPLKALMAERFLYLPSIGFCIFLAFCVKGLGLAVAGWRRSKPIVVSFAVASAILMAYSARTMARNDEWKDGIAISESILRVNPLNPWALTSLGSAQMESKDYETAIKTLKKAVTLSPDYASAHNTLGFCYLEMGRYEEAGGELEAAVRLDPDNVEMRNSLGVTYANLKRYDDAEREFAAAVEKNPLFISAYINLGSLYETRGETDKAMAEYEKAASRAREKAEVAVAYIRMGDLHRKMNNPAEAKASYEKALAISGGKLSEVDRVVGEKIRAMK